MPPNFGELRLRELRRIPLPRTWVNYGMKKGAGEPGSDRLLVS
jgi:hypothetical protein